MRVIVLFIVVAVVVSACGGDTDSGVNREATSTRSVELTQVADLDRQAVATKEPTATTTMEPSLTATLPAPTETAVVKATPTIKPQFREVTFVLWAADPAGKIVPVKWEYSTGSGSASSGNEFMNRGTIGQVSEAVFQKSFHKRMLDGDRASITVTGITTQIACQVLIDGDVVDEVTSDEPNRATGEVSAQCLAVVGAS